MIDRAQLKFLQISKTKLLSWIGYILFFLICFLVFAYWTFPYDRARAHFLNKFNHKTLPGGRTKPNDVQVHIASFEPSWLTGIKMTDIEVVKQTTRLGKDPVKLSFDHIIVRPSIVSLILGKVDLLFSIYSGTGKIKGSYRKDDEELEILAGIDRIDIERLGFDTMVGLPMKGTIDGAINLSIPKDPTKSKGNIHLKLSKVTVGDGKAKLKAAALRDGITIDAINAGDIQLRFKVDKGVGEVEQFMGNGPDLKLDGSGSMRFAKQIKLTRLNLTLELNFTSNYKNRSDRTRALFSLLDMHPTLKRAKTDSGALRYQITGLLTSPRYRPVGKSLKNSRRTSTVRMPSSGPRLAP